MALKALWYDIIYHEILENCSIVSHLFAATMWQESIVNTIWESTAQSVKLCTLNLKYISTHFGLKTNLRQRYLQCQLFTSSVERPYAVRYSTCVFEVCALWGTIKSSRLFRPTRLSCVSYVRSLPFVSHSVCLSHVSLSLWKLCCWLLNQKINQLTASAQPSNPLV